MRLALIVLACCLSLGVEPILAWRYHEKTRFDRSAERVLEQKTRARHVIINKKPRIFTDAATHYTAYKDAAQSVCYLEKLKNEHDDINIWRDVIRGNKKMLHTAEHSLTKIEAWRLAGGRVVDFCHGMKIVLLQDTESGSLPEEDPFYNMLPEDENDIVQKRVADVVLTPLKVRAKRHNK